MMQTHWLVVVAIAGASTAAWLYRPRERTAIATLAAFLSWLLAAFSGGDIETVTDSGSTVAVPAAFELRMLMTAFAVLSAVALLLYVAGVYPPTVDEPMRDQQQTKHT